MDKKGYDNSKITESLSHIRHKLFVLSGKGGVGKSTVAANLAVTLAQKGHDVGLLDSDIHGPSIPKILGIENKSPESLGEKIPPVLALPKLKVMSMGFLLRDNDSPIIWRGPLKMGAIKQFIGDVNWGDLDYLIVDLPPGTGDEPLSIAQLIPDSRGAIIVTTPQDVALVSVRKSINFVKKMDIPIIGIIENMSGFTCPHCGVTTDIFKTGGGMKAADDLQVPFLGKIPLDPQIVETGDSGKLLYGDKTTSNIIKIFGEIAEKIEQYLER